MKSMIVGLVLVSVVFSTMADAPATNAASDEKTVKVTAVATNSPAATNALPPGAAAPPYKLRSGRMITPMLNTNKVPLTNLVQKASYLIGVQNASSVLMSTADGEMLDPELVILGMRDVFNHFVPMLRQDEAEQIMKKFEKAVQEYEVELARKEAEDNRTEGLKFLEENKKKEGVKVSESGLQYKIIKEGAGKAPTENDRVTLHFRSRNIQGFEFNNSYKHAPVTVSVAGQIKGWREALVMMKEGAKWELYIPSDLAYGTREVGRGVGPNSTLIFELELLRVEKSAGK